jgi:hypothetical protein
MQVRGATNRAERVRRSGPVEADEEESWGLHRLAKIPA